MGLINLIIVLSAFFIYWDCTRNHIGKIPEQKSMLNNSAGVWAIGTCLLWIVVFPLYLFNRKKLKQKAVASPQIVSSLRRNLILGVFFLISILVVVGQISIFTTLDSNNMLSDVSGVWKASDDTLVTINLVDPAIKNLQIQDIIIPVIVEQVDSVNHVVAITIDLNGEKEVWTIQKDMQLDDTFFLMLTKPNGTQYNLTFVRNIL